MFWFKDGDNVIKITKTLQVVTRLGSFPLDFVPIAGALHGPMLYLLSDAGKMYLISWAAKDIVSCWNLRQYRPKKYSTAQVCVETALNLIFIRWGNSLVVLQ